MKINKMTASFGKLQNETLELGDGLNIIFAPNESGKSTWCGFIKAMLYGIDTATREKNGVKPDKIKYAPWSGVPMSGTMDIEYEGKRITLTRQGKAYAPMKDFKATLTGTNVPAGNIPASAVGETLVGVTKDVFERSAFISQGKLAVAGSPDLEKRVAAIVQTGQESVSYTEAQERLHAEIRRRRYNRSGRLPELEKEISENREKLIEAVKESKKGDELKKAKRQALERRDELLDKVSELRRQARSESLDKLSGYRGRIKAIEKEYGELSNQLGFAGRELDEGLFGREEPQKSRQRVNLEKMKLMSAEKEARSGGTVPLNIAILAALVVIAAVLAVFQFYIPAGGVGCLAIIQAVRLSKAIKKAKKAENMRYNILAQYRCESMDEVDKLLDAHEAAFKRFSELQAQQQDAAERLNEAKRRQAELDTSLLRELDFADGDSDAAKYTKMLEDAERSLRNIREESALWEGKQSMLPDMDELQKKLAELNREYEQVKMEYDALVLASDVLAEADTDIQRRLTPQLSARTAELFSQLTGSRYDTILLDRELRAAARPVGDSVSREAAFLSAGTIDQLYLSVRLAICEMALPEDKQCPIILDDALVNFDDERCRYAIKVLKDISKKRQVILFSCHSREAEMSNNLKSVKITSLGGSR